MARQDEMKNDTQEASHDLFKSERRESAVDRVINTIKKALIDGKLLPGDKLPSEIELSKRLNISRGSIREAMKILSAFGVVEIRRGNGTYISRSDDRVIFEPLLFSLVLSKENMKELVELRELLEISIVKLVLENAGIDDLDAIGQTVIDLETKVQSGETQPSMLAAADINFHRALGIATKNRMVEKIYHFVIDFFAPSIELTHKLQEKGVLAKTHHRKIYNALVAHDLEGAIESVKESIDVWRNFIPRGQPGAKMKTKGDGG